jgi:aspartyl-tRNA(Asn)/glutamyl-tRNA(Gln) amidotransferase subunit A
MVPYLGPMSSDQLVLLTIREAATLLQKREISPVELIEATLARIDRLQPTLNAFITVMHGAARRDARRAEAEIARGRYRGPLHGIPVSLKDLYCTRGVRTTAGSRVLADFVPTRDSTVTAKLRRAGAIIVGKNNLHEFAPGSTNDNAHWGTCRNPWSLDRIPGGSSGGSAAAVAASLGMVSMGSDTAGSIRIPASLCGVTGLKPTFGRVSCHGVVALACSLDTVGPLARTAEDCALVLEAIAGHDPKDPASIRAPVDRYSEALKGDLAGLRVGVPREHFWETASTEVADLVRNGIRVLERLGATVREVSIPLAGVSTYAANVITRSESAAYHEHWLRTRGADYSPEVRHRLETGFYFSAVDYIKAQQIRTLLRRQLDGVMREVDLVVTPTTPIPAPPIAGGEPLGAPGTAQEAILMLVTLTRPHNMAGFPAISVPCGFTADGLPVGMQLGGRALGEAAVLRAAHAFQQATDWHARRPPV